MRVAVLRFPKSSEAAIWGITESLTIANVVYARRSGKARVFTVEVVDYKRTAILRRGSYDVLVVPPMWYLTGAQTEDHLRELEPVVASLRRAARAVPIVASACSGSVLLAEAGLLDHHRATTSWWLANWFRRRYPATDLHVGESLVKSGKLWTTAAYTSFFYLCLELIRLHMGERTMQLTARLLLVEPHQTPQAAFTDAPDHSTTDRLVRSALRLIEQNLNREMTNRELALQLGVTERTMLRRFQTSLGISPTMAAQSLRIAKAKKLLAETEMTVAEIVEQCGREDVRSFRRLFISEVGMSPLEYRRRFS